jgi:hypothetical protein
VGHCHVLPLGASVILAEHGRQAMKKLLEIAGQHDGRAPQFAPREPPALEGSVNRRPAQTCCSTNVTNTEGERDSELCATVIGQRTRIYRRFVEVARGHVLVPRGAAPMDGNIRLRWTIRSLGLSGAERTTKSLNDDAASREYACR